MSMSAFDRRMTKWATGPTGVGQPWGLYDKGRGVFVAYGTYRQMSKAWHAIVVDCVDPATVISGLAS
jgi:hypothetical protein